MDNRAVDAQRRQGRWWRDAAVILSPWPTDRTPHRTAPHGDFAVAKWLLRQPFHHVVPVARLLRERFKYTLGIAAPADVDERKGVAMRREIGGARVVRVGDVRREREDHRCPRRRAVRRFWQIKCRVQFNLVAHRDFHAPTQIVISGSRRRFLGRRRGRGWWRLRLKEIQCKQQDDERSSPVHHRIEPRTFITTRKFRPAKAICGQLR